jgi:hypothetical protein
MNKSVLTAAVALILILALNAAIFAGDTGTYEILEYRVRLAPQPDGRMEMDYYQKWRVTGGHIPWITVGLANADFQILNGKAGGNAQSVKAEISSDWTGVRIELDRDYRAGETFEVSFTVIQNGLVREADDAFKFDFTPGWYDRAETDYLEIMLACRSSLVSEPYPAPDGKTGDTLLWRTKRGRGEKYTVSAVFDKSAFPQGVTAPKSGPGGCGCGIGSFAGALPFILGVVYAVIRSFIGSGYGFGGTVHRGVGRGYFERERSPGFFGRRGGGFFGSRAIYGPSCVHSSCACACAGCACACACAGGGGAGCDRKIRNQCPLCRDCGKKKNCPVQSEE